MPREKAKIQNYPLQMREVPDRPFNKITIDLVTECETSTSGNKDILTIIDHFIGWPEAFPIWDRSANTIVSTFINKYLPVHMCPRYILSDNDTEFKSNLMETSIEAVGYWTDIFSTLPPTKQWQTGHIPQIRSHSRDAILFAIWKGPKSTPSPNCWILCSDS